MPISEDSKRWMRRLALATIVVFLIGFAISWEIAGRLSAPQSRTIGDPPTSFPAVSISLSTQSGLKISGWHASAEGQSGVIVLLHPVRGSRLSMLDRAKLLYSNGYSVVMIDFQSHGESSGDRITFGYLEKHDVYAAIEYARKEHPSEPIGVVGVSLGGASTLLAAPLDINALVIESVFPDYRDAVHNRAAIKLGRVGYIPSQLLLWQTNSRLGFSPSQLRPIDHIGDFDCPILVLAGELDQHTTVSETRELFSAANHPKELWIVDGAGHEDLHRASPMRYEKRLLAFFSQHL